MKYNLADLSQEEREQVQLNKIAAYLAWQEQQGKLNAIQIDQHIAQQPGSQQHYLLDRLAEYRKRSAAAIV